MEDNKSLNKYEINTKTNVTNENQVNYDRDELKQMTQNIFSENYIINHNNKNSIAQEIRNFIINIKNFYQDSEELSIGDNEEDSEEQSTLEQLIEIVVHHRGNSDIIDNLESLKDENIVTTDEYKELLKFILFLNIMTCEKYRFELWRRDWYDKNWIYDDMCRPNTTAIIQEFTKLFIPHYFAINNPDT